MNKWVRTTIKAFVEPKKALWREPKEGGNVESCFERSGQSL